MSKLLPVSAMSRKAGSAVSTGRSRRHAGRGDVPDTVVRYAVVEADIGDGRDGRLAVDVADRARDGEPAVEPDDVGDGAVRQPPAGDVP